MALADHCCICPSPLSISLIIYCTNRASLLHASSRVIAGMTSLSDLVAYGELTYSGRLPDKGPAFAEVSALIKELRDLDWVPRKTTLRNKVTA
jgi:hypothetical protein